MLALTLILGVSHTSLSNEKTLDGPSILVVGDSHINTSFGTELGRLLRGIDGARVRLVGSCGRWSRAFVRGERAHCGVRTIDERGRKHWARGCARNPCSGRKYCAANACRTPKISALVKTHKPDVTVVELGGNSIYRGTKHDGWKNVAPWVKKLSLAIVNSGSQCIWVTPPHGLNKSPRVMAQFTKFLTRATQGMCTVFDSGPKARPYLNYYMAVRVSGIRSHDKIHYDRLGKTGRRRVFRWAREITTTVKGLIAGGRYGAVWRWARRLSREFSELQVADDGTTLETETLRVARR